MASACHTMLHTQLCIRWLELWCVFIKNITTIVIVIIIVVVAIGLFLAFLATRTHRQKGKERKPNWGPTHPSLP